MADPSASSLQQKFQSLLQGTTALFTSQEQNTARDHSAIDALRQTALALAAEAGTPSFEPFLAYLLGSTSIDAHYSLQVIRMLALITRAVHVENLRSNVPLEDLSTAAFLADMGFRVVWIGQKNSHTELITSRLKDMHFPWFKPGIERLIMNHHEPASDLSPSKIFSLCAHYLAMAYALGTDETLPSTLSPTKAMEALIEEHPQEALGVKILLKTLSAFPLGSWVELSNGQAALVTGTNPSNPLRPRVGIYRAAKTGGGNWEEHALGKEPALHIVRELNPTPGQLALVNHPHLWIRGWQGTGTLSPEEWQSLSHVGSSGEGDGASSSRIRASQSQTVEHLLSGKTLPAAPSFGGAPAPLSKVQWESSEQELKKLRTDWDAYVRVIEESVGKLKMGLVDSYRRENDRYRELLDHMMHRQTSIAPEPIAATQEALEPREVQTGMDARLERLSNEKEAIRAQLRRLREDLAALKDTPLAQRPPEDTQAIQLLIAKTLEDLDTTERELLEPLAIAAPTEEKDWIDRFTRLAQIVRLLGQYEELLASLKTKLKV